MKKKIFIGLLMVSMCFVLVGCGKEESNSNDDTIGGNDSANYNTETCNYTAVEFPTNIDFVDASVKSSYGVLSEVRDVQEYDYVELVYRCITLEGIEAYKEFIVSEGYTTTSTSSLCDKEYTKEGQTASLIVNCYDASNMMKITFQN